LLKLSGAADAFCANTPAFSTRKINQSIEHFISGHVWGETCGKLLPSQIYINWLLAIHK